MRKDPYVYEGTNVLKNKYNIQNEKDLDKAESDFVILAFERLKREKFKIASIYDGLKIHKALFNNIYAWAGELRTIDIYKGEKILGGKSIDYVFASYLQNALRELNNEFVAINWNKFDIKAKIKKICYFVSEFWHIHPFREGNSRTSVVMLYFLAKNIGLHVNSEFIVKNSKYFRNALVLSCLYDASKTQYLLGIVSVGITYKNVETGKYEMINGVEVNKYNYTNHTLAKLKTIKKPKNWNK